MNDNEILSEEEIAHERLERLIALLDLDPNPWEA
jgi:hypothetical protein